MHFNSFGRGQVHPNLRRIVQPHFVFDNLGVQSGFAKLLRHVVGGRFVLGRPRYVRRFGQNPQMLFRQLGVGHSHELLFDFPLAGHIAEATDGPVIRLPFNRLIFLFTGPIKRLQSRTHQHKEKNSARKKFHEAPCRQLCRQLRFRFVPAP